MHLRRNIATVKIILQGMEHPSEIIESPVPPVVHEDLNLLELQEAKEWKLSDLVLPSEQNGDVRTSMQTLNAKFADHEEEPVKSLSGFN